MSEIDRRKFNWRNLKDTEEIGKRDLLIEYLFQTDTVSLLEQILKELQILNKRIDTTVEKGK